MCELARPHIERKILGEMYGGEAMLHPKCALGLTQPLGYDTPNPFYME
jgi:hypothetical protein